VTGGVLLPSQGNSLLTKLDAALALLTNGNTQGAVSKLKDFVKQVSSFIKTGKLTSAQGQPLIDGAQALIVELGGSSALAARTFSANGGVARDTDAPGTAESLRAYPGTFDAARGTITLRFDLPRASEVMLELYDLAGRRIDVARLGSIGPGRHEWSWAPHDNGSGLYFYRLRAGDLTATGKVASVR
jgi:FIMAH domain-containing protein